MSRKGQKGLRKTPVARRFNEQLVKANDQVCFSALQHWEFGQALAPLVGSKPNDFTTTVFPANPFAESIFRRVADLPKFSSDAQQVALRMGVIASAEHVLAYVREVQELRQAVLPSTADSVQDDAEEEQLRLKVVSWSGQSAVAAYFRTIGYFRHLRNHYAHLNDELYPAFATYIRSHGTPLNRFWSAQPTDLHGVDFQTLAKISLTPDLTFGMMNLLRVSLQHVDHIVASTLAVPRLVSWILLDLLGLPANRQLQVDRLASKISGRLDMEWNIQRQGKIVRAEVERLLNAA